MSLITPTAGAGTRSATARQHGGSRRIRIWDLPTRVFHWALVAAVLVAVVTGQVGGDWMPVHGIAGLTILGLVVFRLVWGVIGSTHSRFVSFAPTPRKVVAYLRGRWRGVGHNPLGAISVLLLLGLLAAQAGSGLFSNDDIAFTGPWAASIGEALSSRLTGLHHQLADVLLILIGLHVAAIAAYLLLKKDNLVKPMVTGYKAVESGEPTRQGGWLAFIVALALAIGAVLFASGALRHKDAPPPPPAAGTTAKPAAW
jgi:cytochrome b